MAKWHHLGSLKKYSHLAPTPRDPQIITQRAAWASRRLKTPQVIFNPLPRLRTNDTLSQECNNHFHNFALCPRSELYLNEPTRAVVNSEHLPRIETNPVGMQEAGSQVLLGVSAIPESQVRSFGEAGAWLKTWRSGQVFLLQPVTLLHVTAT